ncbi:MAG: hypothetical protein ACP5UQ_07170, partial [Anaerolineae bacterium]
NEGYLMSSADRGETWTTVPLPAGVAGGPLAYRGFVGLDYNNPQTIYLGAVTQGLWRSSDGGASWSRRHLYPFGPVAVSFDHPDHLLGGLIGPNELNAAVANSMDGGLTWVAHGGGITGEVVSPILIDPLIHNLSYVIAQGPRGGATLYRTFDGNWEAIPNAPLGLPPSGGPGLGLALDGGSRGLYVASADGILHVSVNAHSMNLTEIAWTPVYTFTYGLLPIPLAVGDGPAGSALYVTLYDWGTAYGRTLRSDDGGRTWRPLTLPAPALSPTATATPTHTPGRPTATLTPTMTPTPTATPTATPTTIAVPTAQPGTWPTPRVIATLALPAGSHPHGIALDATGNTAYVAFHGVDHSGRTLGVINTAPLTITAQITLSTEATGPNGVAVIGGSGPVIVTNRQTANASVVNPGPTPAVIGEIPANLLPDGVVVNGGFGYIANFGNNTVTVFDPTTRAVVNTLAVGQQPSLFAADPTNGDVYLSLHGSNEVQLLRGGALIGTYTGIPEPYGVAYDPTGRRLYVANRGAAHTVTVLDTATGNIVGAIGLDREPFVVAVNPRTGHLYIACGDQVQVYRTLDWAPVTTIPVPPGAEEGIALDEARNIVYVTSRDGDVITAIQDTSPPLVLFASNRDGNGELYRMMPDGREQIRLTFTAAAGEVSPVGSPDGRWIAYVRTDSDGRPHLWLMNRDGHNARQISFGTWEDDGPSWSGDGSRLVFASNRDGNWEIYTLRPADGAITRLTFNGAEDRSPSWSWANGRIAFQSNRYGPNPEIFSMAADGSDVQLLTINPNGDRGPSWSADGQYIVFWGSRGEQTLYRMRANGLDVVPLVSYLLRPEGAAWGPGSAGGWIVFSGYRPGSGHSEILRMTSSGGGVALLTFNEVNFDYSPGWLPEQ